MMMELEDLGWIAVNLRGTTADVHVQERVLPPALLDRASPCNVVAAQAGQILSMKVYVGQTMAAAVLANPLHLLPPALILVLGGIFVFRPALPNKNNNQ